VTRRSIRDARELLKLFFLIERSKDADVGHGKGPVLIAREAKAIVRQAERDDQVSKPEASMIKSAFMQALGDDGIRDPNNGFALRMEEGAQDIFERFFEANGIAF
jgi:hypothetical protein